MLSEDLCWCRELQALQDFALSSGQASRLHFAAQAVIMNQQRVIREGPQNGLCRRAAFLFRSVRGEALPIEPLHQEVQHQRDDHQEHQRLDALRRMQKDRADLERSFEAPVDVLAVVLFLELGEQRIGSGLRSRHRCHQRRIAVVLFVVLLGIPVEAELQPVARRLQPREGFGRRLCSRLVSGSIFQE